MIDIEDNWNIGIDMIEHRKFQRFNPSSYPHFYERVFTLEERAYCGDQLSRYAGIFAAKEAIFKALSSYGTNYLSQYEIQHDAKGQPYLRDLDNPDQEPYLITVDGRKIRVKISISHTSENSIAIAIARLED